MNRAPLQSSDDLLAVYTDLPDSTSVDARTYMAMTNETAGLLSGMLEAARTEDTLFPKQPEKKANRIALLDASSSPEGVAKSYELYDELEKLGEDGPFARRRIQHLLGYMNNYDPYINVQGVLERSSLLRDQYANGEDSSREERLAVVAMQAMDIMAHQRQREFAPESRKVGEVKKMEHGYEMAHAAISEFLNESGASTSFINMGFSLGKRFEEYATPKGHPDFARVTALSGKDQEIAFITVHQVFEVFFEEALCNLRKCCEAGDAAKIGTQQIQDVSLLLKTSNAYYGVLMKLLEHKPFHFMRESFGIASGAQSQQYHLMENYIGYTGDTEASIERIKSITYLIGKERISQIRQEIPPERSLKALCTERKDLYPELRELNLQLLNFKAVHGNAMLAYLPPHVPGSGGTAITHFFADGMGPIFPVFSPQEVEALEQATYLARHIPRKPTDKFVSAMTFVKTASSVQPNTCQDDKHC